MAKTKKTEESLDSYLRKAGYTKRVKDGDSRSRVVHPYGALTAETNAQPVGTLVKILSSEHDGQIFSVEFKTGAKAGETIRILSKYLEPYDGRFFWKE
jgi:hypothetical protein